MRIEEARDQVQSIKEKSLKRSLNKDKLKLNEEKSRSEKFLNLHQQDL